MVTKEEFQDWRSMEATAEAINQLESKFLILRDGLRHCSSWDDYQRTCGRIDGIEDAINSLEEVSIKV